MSSPIPSSAPTTPSKSIVLSKRRKLEGRTQGAISTETREGENRYPSKRTNASEFAAFQRGKENFENSEDSLPSYTSQAVPSSPCTPSKSQSTSQSTTALISKNKTVGSLVSITEEHTAGAPSKRPPSPLQKFKIIDLNLEYTVDDIPEIPTTTYNAQNYHQIPQDWRLQHTWKPTAEYEYRRNKWRLWKDIFVTFRLAGSNWDTFHDKYATIQLPDGSSRPESNFNKICASIAGIRKVENTEHARLARQEYIRGDFEKHFSSRKSGKTTIMKGDQEIARRYRKHKGIASMWDEYFD
ncbi:hypothetical protein F5882DRAFT_421028 [Hyaloscypha sp. PMI_1271]|nr:hypothetical protein F5882DRAFT_421028 [Hyaloscypha sp. PMI_1271]